MPRRNNGARLRFLEKRGCYYIVWTERGRSRERSTGTADRRDAEIALANFLRQQPGRVGPKDPSEILVTDILAEYALDRSPDVQAPVRMAYAIGPLTEYFAGRTVQDVTKQTCKGYGSYRNRAAGTVRRDLGVLRAAINHAHREGKLTRPVPVDLPDHPTARTRWLTRDEAARLLKAAMDEPRVRLHLPLFIVLGLYTGQRKEAILSLRWPMVDLTNNRMDFRLPGRKETKKKRSHTQIPPRLLSHLRHARRRGTDLGHVVNENGVRILDIKNGFASACVRAGLKDVTPHTLRHTCATWLMQAGVPKWEAAGFLAMSMDTLERVYGHHHPDHYSEAANAFSRRPRNVRATGAK
jgi:integrase